MPTSVPPHLLVPKR